MNGTAAIMVAQNYAVICDCTNHNTPNKDLKQRSQSIGSRAKSVHVRYLA